MRIVKNQENDSVINNAEADESSNNRQHGLMLDEVREAMNSMAYYISMHSSGVAPDLQNNNQASSSEKTPSVTLEQPDDNESEVEDYVVNILLEIEDAQSIAELDDIYKKYYSKISKLRGKNNLLKSQEILQAYLTLMTTLNMLRKQIELMRQNPTNEQLALKRIAENITQRLLQNQLSFRLAAERVLESARLITSQNLAQQLKAAEIALKSVLQNQQRQQSANEVNILQQRLAKFLEMLQKTQIAQQQRLSAEQNTKLFGTLVNSSELANRLLQQRLAQLRQEQTRLQAERTNNPANTARLTNILEAQRLAETAIRTTQEVNLAAQNRQLVESTRQAIQQLNQQQLPVNQPLANTPATNNTNIASKGVDAAIPNNPNKIASNPSPLEAEKTAQGIKYALGEKAQAIVREAIQKDIAQSVAQKDSTPKDLAIRELAQKDIAGNNLSLKEDNLREPTNVIPNERELIAKTQAEKPERNVGHHSIEQNPQLKDLAQFDRAVTAAVTEKDPTNPIAPPKPEITTPCKDCHGEQGCCSPKTELTVEKFNEIAAKITATQNAPNYSTNSSISQQELQQYSAHQAKAQMQTDITVDLATKAATGVTQPIQQDDLLDSMFASTVNAHSVQQVNTAQEQQVGV